MSGAFGVGIAGWGTYWPEQIQTAREIAELSGLPVQVLEEKIGVRQKRVAGPEDHCSVMAAKAGEVALRRARVDADDVDLVLYHGSEFKDHVVWSAATKVQALLGCRRAAAFEAYALCAGTPVALKIARGLMRDDESLRRVLLVTASRESDLVSYQDAGARFMYSFGAGGGALLLSRDLPEHQLLGSAVISDGSLSDNVVMPAGGSRKPCSAETTAAEHRLTTWRLEEMGARLAEVSMPNFEAVVRRALEGTGKQPHEIAFLGAVHMKRSFHKALLDRLGLPENRAIYLEDYGHVQSVDQVLALELAAERGLLTSGDLVVLLGAGTGYTWSATAIRW
ncbi:MAG: 3-oxoacyl-ACP synthase [Polyangiaceae bacterium]